MSYQGMRACIRFGVLGVLFLVGCASSSRPDARAWKISPADKFIDKVPPPPALHSPEVKQGVRAVLELQAGATPRKIASARWTYDYSVFTYSLALGPSFKAKKYPITARFFARLNAVVAQVNDVVKDHYKFPHPFQVNPGVRRFVDAIPGYDYPSFHSARCAVFERVLSILDAERRREFIEASWCVEKDRVFAGEHFPFSIQAGKELGERIFIDLSKDPSFRADLVALKEAEWTPPPDSRNSF